MVLMKLLFVITSTDVGGAERALADLALSLHTQHEVHIISLRKVGEVGRHLQAEGIPVASLDMNAWNQVFIPGRIRRFIRSWKPDIIHAMLFRAIEFTRLAVFGMRVRLVTTPHYDLSKKSSFSRFVDKSLRELDCITVAESFSTARYLTEKQGYAKQKVYLLPNGVSPKLFFKDETLRKLMREKHNIAPEQVVFLSVSRLAAVKNTIVQLQALRNVLRNHANAKLVLVGEGPQRARLEEYIYLNALQDTVLLAGEQTDINAWLNMADVFVLSSEEESLPLALLEALQAGLPCLVSRVGDMPVWVEHGQNGFVFTPHDITLLSCLMSELMDVNVRDRLGKGSLQKALQIRDTSQQYQQVYQQIVTQGFHVETKNPGK